MNMSTRPQLYKIAQQESFPEKLGRYWGTYVPLILNHPVNYGRKGPNQYFDVLRAGFNARKYKDAANRISKAPGGALEYFSDPDNAGDAELIHDALDNKVAAYEAKAARARDRHLNTIAETKKWRLANPGKEIPESELNKIRNAYDTANPRTDLDQTREQLGAVINHAKTAPGGYAKNFATTMRMFRDAKAAADYLIPADSSGKVVGRENFDDYFSDEAKGHIDAIHRLTSDPGRLNILKSVDKNIYNDLEKYKNHIAFASKNHGALKSLWSLYNNPLMWIVRALVIGDRNAFAAIRGMHDMTTNRNSEWYRAANDAMKDLGFSPEERERGYAALKNKVNPYMPWARLLHNVRGVAGGSKDFKPITYRGIKTANN